MKFEATSPSPGQSYPDSPLRKHDPEPDRIPRRDTNPAPNSAPVQPNNPKAVPGTNPPSF